MSQVNYWAQSINFCVWPWFSLDICLIHFSNLVKGLQTQLNVKPSSLLKLGGLYIKWSMAAINYTATMEERDVQGESTPNTVIKWPHALTLLAHVLSWDCYIFQKACVSSNIRPLMKAKVILWNVCQLEHSDTAEFLCYKSFTMHIIIIIGPVYVLQGKH
jgi:hypothetical protein